MNFSLLKIFLNNTAYIYYPKYMHDSDPDYNLTVEHKNYLSMHSMWKTNLVMLDEFLNEIHLKFGSQNVKAFGTTNRTPCYEVEIFIDDERLVKRVVTIYISLLIPFYHIVVLTRQANGSITHSFKIPKEMESFIEKAVYNNLGYSKFPEDLIDLNVPKLNVLEGFNYKSAFFTDFYRMT